jgi:sensory rhodopsin
VAIPGIAIVAYALLYLGVGAIQVDGHTVYVVRYVDWLLTTPINVLYLALLANAARTDTTKLVGLQALTIVFGFAGAVTPAPISYGLFALGGAAFAGVVYLLYGAIGSAATTSLSGLEAGLYRTLRNFVVVLWLVYPVVWLLGQAGIGIMDVETTSLVVAYLDVVTKVGFGLIALYGLTTLVSVNAGDTVAVSADD